MKHLTLLLLIFLTLTLKAQKKYLAFSPINEIYKNWSKYSIIGNYQCDTFFYADKIDNYTIKRLQNLLLADSVFIKYNPKGDTSNAERIFLSQVERDQLAKQIDSLSFFKWTNKMFKKSKMMSLNSVQDVLAATKNSKDSFEYKLCKKIYSFSKPVFFRRNKYCLFYFGKSNYIIKEGEFWIYRKEKNKWVKYTPLYQWVE